MYVQLQTPQSRPLAGAHQVDDDVTLLARNLIEPAGVPPLTVQLIHPPQRTSGANIVSAVTIPPLGLAYLAGALESAGHRVDVLDAIGEKLDRVFYWKGRALRGLEFDEIVQGINPDADIIGIGMMFSCSWAPLRDLVRMIKDRFPDKPIVLGGEHPTALPELVFAQSPTDFVVRGEGEVTLVDLCNRLATGRDVTDTPGLALRDADAVRINPKRDRIRDVDAIPRPAWRHFNIAGYIAYNQPHGSAEGRSMPMLATRGCPFQCTFCGSPGMWGTSWRPRAPRLVADEIEAYVDKYGANDFQFEDLTAITRKDWVLAFCKELMQRGLKITWQLPSGTRSEAIDAEAAKAMFASGCRQFTYALESGSEVILKRIKKRIRLDRAFASAKDAMSEGVRVQGAFIVGFPGETWGQMWQTYRAILRCAMAGFHEINVSALQPLPNTELFHELNEQREVVLDDEYFDSIFGYLGIWQQRSWNDRISNTTLRLIIFLSLASFFTASYLRRPGRLWTLMRSLSASQTQGKLPRILKGMVKEAREIRAAKPRTKYHAASAKGVEAVR